MPARFVPGEGVASRPRLTAAPLPPYSYVPGREPHPLRDPAGHLFGQEEPEVAPLIPGQCEKSATYLRGIDLFNHGYYWEAHEAWEALWHAAGRHGTTADFLKGLIKLAAAGVKAREGNCNGIRRHARRAADLFSGVADATPENCFAGLSLESLGFLAKFLEKEPFSAALLNPRWVLEDAFCLQPSW